MTTQADIDNWFTYHPPIDDMQAGRYAVVRFSGGAFAESILTLVPAGAEQDRAIAAIREAVMWANAGIACAPA